VKKYMNNGVAGTIFVFVIFLHFFFLDDLGIWKLEKNGRNIKKNKVHTMKSAVLRQD